MEAAGKGWQFGKRKISAMSNEDFNKLTPHKILEDSLGEYKLMIPSMTQAFDESRLLQTKIIEVMVGYAVQLLSDIEKGLTAALAGQHEHAATRTAIKNPFVSSFLTPAIIPPIPTEDLIPLTDQHIHDTATVADFNEFTQQQAEDVRKQKLRDEAQQRFESRKQIQLPSITPRFTDPRRAATATKKVVTDSIKNVQRQISQVNGTVKVLTKQVQVQQSQLNALIKARSQTRNRDFRNTYAKRIAASNKKIQTLKQQIQQSLLKIGTLNVLLAKTKRLL